MLASSPKQNRLGRVGGLLLLGIAGGVVIDGILVLWYFWPDEAPAIIAGLLFCSFLLASVVVIPCLGIFWLIADRRKWRKTLITVSLVGLAITIATVDVSFGSSHVDLGRGYTHLTLNDGWVWVTRYGPAPPARWPGDMPQMNPVLWSESVPLFIPLALFAVLPSVEITHWLGRRRRRRSGLCESCGYDLCGSMRQCSECGTNVGRCPECGIVVVEAGEFHAVASS